MSNIKYIINIVELITDQKKNNNNNIWSISHNILIVYVNHRQTSINYLININCEYIVVGNASTVGALAFRWYMTAVCTSITRRSNLVFAIFKYNNHHGYVVYWAAIVRLQRYAFRAKMWLIDVVLDEGDCFLVGECVPQAIRCQYQKFRSVESNNETEHWIRFFFYLWFRRVFLHTCDQLNRILKYPDRQWLDFSLSTDSHRVPEMWPEYQPHAKHLWML